MAQVNITQAAKLAGVSRTTLYNTYIRSGQITVSKDKNGNKQVDTSEWIRVFGELQTEQLDNTAERLGEQQLTPTTAHAVHIEQLVRLAELETENRMLKDQVSQLKEQQGLDRGQIRELSTKLLEHHRPGRLWWQFWK